MLRDFLKEAAIVVKEMANDMWGDFKDKMKIVADYLSDCFCGPFRGERNTHNNRYCKLPRIHLLSSTIHASRMDTEHGKLPIEVMQCSWLSQAFIDGRWRTRGW